MSYFTEGGAFPPPGNLPQVPDLRRWVGDQHAVVGSTHCNYRPDISGRWCTRPWCSRHGQFRRIEVANKIIRAKRNHGTYFAAVVRYDALLDREPMVASKDRLCRQLRSRLSGCEVLAVPHFQDLTVHWNLTIFCYCTWRQDAVRQIVKQEWTEALQRIGIPDPSRRRTYCSEVADFEKWTNYVLRTKEMLHASECPPPDRRWRLYPTRSPFFVPSIPAELVQKQRPARHHDEMPTELGV